MAEERQLERECDDLIARCLAMAPDRLRFVIALELSNVEFEGTFGMSGKDALRAADAILALPEIASLRKAAKQE